MIADMPVVYGFVSLNSKDESTLEWLTMMLFNISKAKWVPLTAVVFLSGCMLGPIYSHQEEDLPVSDTVQEAQACPSCEVAKPVLPTGDCAKAVAVVNYADSCQACGRFPVTVRAYGNSENCK